MFNVAIISRLYPGREAPSTEGARALLSLRLDCKDADRFQELLTKQQDETLIPDERGELRSYLRVNALFFEGTKARRLP